MTGGLFNLAGVLQSGCHLKNELERSVGESVVRRQLFSTGGRRNVLGHTRGNVRVSGFSRYLGSNWIRLGKGSDMVDKS